MRNLIQHPRRAKKNRKLSITCRCPWFAKGEKVNIEATCQVHHELLSFLEPNIAVVFTSVHMFSLPPDRVLRNIPEPKDFPSPSRANHAVVRCHSFWGGSQSIRNIVFLFLCIITSLLTSKCHSVSQCPFCCNFSRVVHSGRASQQEHSNSIGKQRSQGHSLGAPMPGLPFTVILLPMQDLVPK